MYMNGIHAVHALVLRKHQNCVSQLRGRALNMKRRRQHDESQIANCNLFLCAGPVCSMLLVTLPALQTPADRASFRTAHCLSMITFV